MEDSDTIDVLVVEYDLFAISAEVLWVLLGTPTCHLPLSSIILSTMGHIADCYIYGILGVNSHGQVIGMNTQSAGIKYLRRRKPG